MTTPGGVPNLPLGALTLDTLASKTQDMTTTAMKSRAVERFPTIFNNSTGLNPALDITPFGILTGIFSGFNSQVANADPADVNGPEDLPGLLLQFIEGIPVIGQFVDLLDAILGTYTGTDTTLLTVQAIFAPIRAIVDALTAVSGGTGGLGNFFPDLLGLLGNPTGLGSGGTVGLGSLSSIPLFGPLFSIFGGATTSTQAGNFFTSITGLFGNPTGLLTGSPTVPALGSIPILGPVFGLFNGASNATQATNFITSIMSLFGNPTGTLTGSPTVPALGSIPILGPVFGLFGGASNATQAGDFFTNLQSFLGGPTLTSPPGTSPGSFSPSAAAESFITTILNPSGLLQDIPARQNAQGVIDGGVQAVFGGTGVGHLVSEFFDAFQNTATSSSDGYMNSVINLNTLSIRTNNPVMGALERTTVANMTLADLGTGSTPTNFAVTEAASAIALVRMPQSDTKGLLYWRSSGNTSITGFFLNFGKLALDGTVTPLFSSGNLASQLTSGWQWQKYVFPGGSKITHLASENIVVEYQVVGSGTVTIAGQPLAWMTDDHPDATTKRVGATRNLTGSSAAAALSNTGFNFSGNAPFTGLGRSDVPVGYVPPDIQTFPTAGAYTYTIPPSLRVAGTLIDYFAVGAGGGGQSGGYWLPGQGGEAGHWQYGTLVYGTDIPLGTTAFTGSIPGSAAGGPNPFVFQPGDNGGSTTIVVPTYGTITATGGLGGGQSGNSQGTDGQAAGSRTITDYTAQGGAAAGTNQNGNAPGGGGGCGYPAVGHPSGGGKAWFRARQP